MANTKQIRRVQLRLQAKTYPELVQMQLDVAKEKDREFVNYI